MSRIAAIFDVDGTLVRADVVDYYLFFLHAGLTPGRRFLRYLRAAVQAPYWLALDRIDRARFNRSFYGSYRGLSASQIEGLCQACFEQIQSRRLIGPVVQRLEEHRNRGDRILLVSGSLDFILRPLAEHLHAEACLCPSLEEEEGSFSGVLSGAPVIGDEKARLLMDYAREHGIDLKESYAYADSVSDLPILRLVGHPAVVEPRSKLGKIAQQNGWEVLR